jgi:hydrogenase maturation protein HypF
VSAVAPAAAAARLHVSGVVQGVGFRPFVHRLATRHGLGGWVRNEAGDVHIEVEGTAAAIDGFTRALQREAPPLARIERVELEHISPLGRTAFEIRPSTVAPDRRQPISPDAALCAACLAELFDPANRRYRYPFITCTDCGPRFTVIEAMPYDRERTSMRVFDQCPACLAEYRDPTSRRHHSETNSCPGCGPHVWLQGGDVVIGRRPGDDPIAAAARLLGAGLIVAIRGLGGFHLAALATDERAVRRLRARKGREAKPLAVMVSTIAQAREIASISSEEAALLASRERPIVLLTRRADAPLATSIAPGLDTVGVMLAYTPLHHLLLERAGRPLVMTSGNLTDEPIATANDDALRRLATVADAYLLHDREIVARYDDSVVRVAAGTTVFLRRARGYAPLPVDLPEESPRPLVAVGPHLKNTFALVHGRRAYVSQHIGDLENLETLEHFQSTLGDFKRLYRVEPEVVVRDLHPGYLSSRVAGELGLEQIIAVQHHHAHVAAVLAEHGHTGPALGIAFDGTGYGDDGCVWGAEFLVASLERYTRVARLRYVPLPGGDVAARRPWRVVRGYLSLEPDAAEAFRAAFIGVEPRELDLADQQLRAGLNSPLASSMGRLFDAAAAILGVRSVARYEGEAAMELEALAGRRPALPWPMGVRVGTTADGVTEVDPLPLLVALGNARANGESAADLAAVFHESIAAAAAELAVGAAEAAGVHTVALGGGCFQNARLLVSVRERLVHRGLDVLIPRRLSPNDGAISYGQAAVAVAQLRASGHQDAKRA